MKFSFHGPLLFALFVCASALRGADGGVVYPYEAEGGFVTAGPIDEAVLAGLKEHGLSPSNRCSDEVFVRRVYLDVIGALPTPKEVEAFLADKRPVRRAELIDALLKRDEFADYWAMKWSDLLRVKAEFPINLWPNAVQVYHRWIHDAIAANRPYDQFACELLTSSGSNFRVPPVNFYRAVQGQTPSSRAAAVALTFMGTRLDKWPSDRRAGFEAFFSRLAFKKTTEWKEEIVFADPSKVEPLDAMFPDGKTVRIGGDDDPRVVFADWLITAENPWFTRNIANRVWSWLMGRGIIHETDDIRADNPPSNPALLTVLEKELVKNRYDLRQLYRVILNSATYQQSSIPRSNQSAGEALFASYPVRRLDAEVLVDALCDVSGSKERYSSPIPEPFTFIPGDNRSISLADGSTTSQFLELFGRPPRDTGLESERNNQPTDEQRLHLLNSRHILQKIEQSGRVGALMGAAKGNVKQVIGQAYLAILSRRPTPSEIEVAEKYFQTPGLPQRQATNDLAWALINTKEFLYRH
jgi:hypothetical protein